MKDEIIHTVIEGTTHEMPSAVFESVDEMKDFYIKEGCDPDEVVLHLIHRTWNAHVRGIYRAKFKSARRDQVDFSDAVNIALEEVHTSPAPLVASKPRG